jgi:hypothetical protein
MHAWARDGMRKFDTKNKLTSLESTPNTCASGDVEVPRNSDRQTTVAADVLPLAMPTHSSAEMRGESGMAVPKQNGIRQRRQGGTVIGQLGFP